ncbi:MAG TPA: GNAT family N-acetyltransferase [Ktedonobacterales bacterium]
MPTHDGESVTYRIATVNDLDAVGALRWAMETERHPEQAGDHAAYIAVVNASIRDEFARGSQIAFLAESGGDVIACALLIWWAMIPTLLESHRARGYVSTVYTIPDYRRRGIARQLMTNLMTHARELGVSRLILRASEMGRPLYLDLGFAPSDSLEWNEG